MRLGMLLLAAGMLLYPLVPSVWVLIVVIPFVPIGTALMFPAITSLLSHATDPAELGTTMGVAQTFAGHRTGHCADRGHDGIPVDRDQLAVLPGRRDRLAGELGGVSICSTGTRADGAGTLTFSWTFRDR